MAGPQGVYFSSLDRRHIYFLDHIFHRLKDSNMSLSLWENLFLPQPWQPVSAFRGQLGCGGKSPLPCEVLGQAGLFSPHLTSCMTSGELYNLPEPLCIHCSKIRKCKQLWLGKENHTLCPFFLSAGSFLCNAHKHRLEETKGSVSKLWQGLCVFVQKREKLWRGTWLFNGPAHYSQQA